MCTSYVCNVYVCNVYIYTYIYIHMYIDTHAKCTMYDTTCIHYHTYNAPIHIFPALTIRHWSPEGETSTTVNPWLSWLLLVPVVACLEPSRQGGRKARVISHIYVFLLNMLFVWSQTYVSDYILYVLYVYYR